MTEVWGVTHPLSIDIPVLPNQLWDIEMFVSFKFCLRLCSSYFQGVGIPNGGIDRQAFLTACLPVLWLRVMSLAEESRLGAGGGCSCGDRGEPRSSTNLRVLVYGTVNHLSASPVNSAWKFRCFTTLSV
jgi:hypothetical protein